MSYESARFAVESYFKTQWDAYKAANPDLWFPIEYPNNRLPENDKSGPWGRLSIANGPAFGREVGTGSTRVPGVIYLQIFLPEDTGVVIAKKATDYMVDKFLYRQFEIDDGVLRVRSVSGRELPAESGRDRTNVEVVFARDATNPAASAFADTFVPLPTP
jgi:hypothetical protein